MSYDQVTALAALRTSKSSKWCLNISPVAACQSMKLGANGAFSGAGVGGPAHDGRDVVGMFFLGYLHYQGYSACFAKVIHQEAGCVTGFRGCACAGSE